MGLRIMGCVQDAHFSRDVLGFFALCMMVRWVLVQFVPNGKWHVLADLCGPSIGMPKVDQCVHE